MFVMVMPRPRYPFEAAEYRMFVCFIILQRLIRWGATIMSFQ
jgi:hypothetical protein